MSPNATPIRASDRLQQVFERDERLVDVMASHSPQLAKLRNSPMRRIMARVTTVEQAARLCGVSATSLVGDLNRALGLATTPDDHDIPVGPTGGRPAPEVGATGGRPARGRPAHAPSVELDVRDDLRNGREPFSRIITAVAALHDGEVLHLRATFEPVPLFALLDKRGFAHDAEQHAPDDWSAWFYRPTGSPEQAGVIAPIQSPTARPDATATNASADPALTADALREVPLDVRGLEPPEPMVRTLEALEQLPAGRVLLHINIRVPQLLLPILAERGFQFTIDQSVEDQVQVRIWRPQ